MIIREAIRRLRHGLGSGDPRLDELLLRSLRRTAAFLRAGHDPAGGNCAGFTCTAAGEGFVVRHGTDVLPVHVGIPLRFLESVGVRPFPGLTLWLEPELARWMIEQSLTLLRDEEDSDPRGTTPHRLRGRRDRLMKALRAA